MKNKRVKSKKLKVERKKDLNIRHGERGRAAEQPSNRAAKQKGKGKKRKLNSVALINGKIILRQGSFRKSLEALKLEDSKTLENGFKGERYDFH